MFNFDKSIKSYAVRLAIKAALVSTVVAAPLVPAVPQDASAKVTGQCCNCHTMHNSQGADPMVSGGGGTVSSLLIDSCVGCHSSADSSTTYDLGDSTVPVVNYIGSGQPTEYLAGGNFYWVKEGNTEAADSKGHNVFLNEDDEALEGGAPGANVALCGTDACHVNLSKPSYGSSYLTYVDDGDYGCKGCHLNERHHADDDGDGGVVTTPEQGYYRFLTGHAFTGKGAQGYEDPNWEAGQPNLPAGGANHNEYLGSSTATSLGFNGGAGGNGTTAFCTGCHGLFHSTDSGQTGVTWLRHPSDAVIPDRGEYADVGGSSHLYDPLSPVAKATIDTTPDTTVAPDSDMVMCLSCHRPHASPYPDLLRWDYAGNMIAGGTPSGDNYTGCFYCHTLKDDG
ncbi:MAG: hypothetical protein KAR13_15010 [Desulfobulbaceae bacterium]|nr:hypothetical protein [Desulfobulbaceae bacterium]